MKERVCHLRDYLRLLWAEKRTTELILVGLLLVFIAGCLVGGCNTPLRSAKTLAATVDSSLAASLPANSPDQEFLVLWDEANFVPDMVCLMPGQSAELVEEVTVRARIPYRGDELWTGPVRLLKGTMLVKATEER